MIVTRGPALAGPRGQNPAYRPSDIFPCSQTDVPAPAVNPWPRRRGQSLSTGCLYFGMYPLRTCIGEYEQ